MSDASWNKVEKDIEALLRSQKLVPKGADADDFFQDLDAGVSKVPRMSTGLFKLDYILGGGIPRGRIVEIMGPESSGKTTLALQIIAYLQVGYFVLRSLPLMGAS